MAQARTIPPRPSEYDTCHTVSFGPELPTTFNNTLRGLLDKPRPLYVLLWLDPVGSGKPEDLTGPHPYSAQKIISHTDLVSLAEGDPEDANYDEDYIVVFPCDEEGERVDHSEPRFIPTWHIARLHVD